MFTPYAGVKISVKDAAMKTLYGEGVSNADVLDEKVPQLPEVMPLLEDLKALIKSTPVY